MQQIKTWNVKISSVISVAKNNKQFYPFYILINDHRPQPPFDTPSTCIKVEAPSTSVHTHVSLFLPSLSQVSFDIQVVPTFSLPFNFSFFVLFPGDKRDKQNEKHIQTHTPFLDQTNSANTFCCLHSKLMHVLAMAYF